MDNKHEAAPDAIALLTQDHKNVKKMFDEYEGLGDKAVASKKKLANTICDELIVHTKIEEEIFYPAVRAAIDDDDLMDEADVEHAGAKDLIAQIQSMEPGDSHYDAKVKVLGEEIDHHVKEEQEEMFPEVRKAKLDLKALGAQMAARKEELKEAAKVA
ncbi:MAG: hemerythrin domain-containing protein [Betaproteobacteria bacterium]